MKPVSGPSAQTAERTTPPSKDLDFEMKQTKKRKWDNINRKLTLTTRDFVYYYNYKHFQETGEHYAIKELNWYYFGNIFKKHVLDEFVVRGFGVPEMKELIDWIFLNKKPNQWNLKWLKHHVSDWLNRRAVKSWMKKVMTEDQLRARKLEEQQFARYLGEGYFDNQLTKEQYWIGLLLRKKNIPEEKLEELRQWQKKEFTPQDRERLKEWRIERKTVKFNEKKWFFIELAKSKNQTILELLHELRKERLYELFTKEELERVW